MTPAQLQALKAELLADPGALGYAAPLAVGNHEAVAVLLNDPSKGGTFNRPSVSSDLLRCSVIESEYTGLSTANKNYLGFLLGGGEVYLTSAIKSWVNGLTGFTTSKAAMAALFTRPQSRAEALFGEGTVIGAHEVGASLQLP